jgi:hypothetical protein
MCLEVFANKKNDLRVKATLHSKCSGQNAQVKMLRSKDTTALKREKGTSNLVLFICKQLETRVSIPYN